MKYLSKILITLGLIISIVAFALGLFYKITNIDMTDLRLFVTYWYVWVAFIVGAMSVFAGSVLKK